MSTPEEMDIGYRHVPTLIGNFAVSATFIGHESTRAEIEQGMEAPRSSAARASRANRAPDASSKIQAHPSGQTRR